MDTSIFEPSWWTGYHALAAAAAGLFVLLIARSILRGEL
jgi:hypothetical protein